MKTHVKLIIILAAALVLPTGIVAKQASAITNPTHIISTPSEQKKKTRDNECSNSLCCKSHACCKRHNCIYQPNIGESGGCAC